MATVYEIFRQCWTEKRGLSYWSTYFDFEMLWIEWTYELWIG